MTLKTLVRRRQKYESLRYSMHSLDIFSLYANNVIFKSHIANAKMEMDFLSRAIFYFQLKR